MPWRLGCRGRNVAQQDHQAFGRDLIEVHVHGAERSTRPLRLQQAIDKGVDFIVVALLPGNIGLAPVTLAPLFRQRL